VHGCVDKSCDNVNVGLRQILVSIHENPRDGFSCGLGLVVKKFSSGERRNPKSEEETQT